MFRTLTILSLQKWAYDIAPLLGAHSTQILQNKSEQMLEETKSILNNVLDDNQLNYPNIRNNIEIGFDERWGIRIEADTSEIPYFKYLDQGYDSYDMKIGLLNSRLPKHFTKDGRMYVNVPLKKQYGEVDFRRLYEYGNKSPWIHPGYRGRHILAKTTDRANRMVRRKLRNSFSEMLGV